MKKSLLIIFLLISIISNAQIRNGYTNYTIYDSGIPIVADSIDTCHDWRISPSWSITNDDLDHWNTIWQQFRGIGDLYNIFVSKGLTYSNPVWITSIEDTKISYGGLPTQYIKGNGVYTTFPTIPSNTNQLTNGSGYIIKSDLSATAGVVYNNSTGVFSNTDYWNTGTTTSGAVIFYLTSDKTSSGTALYSTVDYVNPLVNDVTQNYTYGWSYNSTTKALTVSAKTNLTAVITLLTVVLEPTNVSNGTSIQVVVKGH